MGSTGTGRFTDYSDSSTSKGNTSASSESSTSSGGSSSTSGGGGLSGEDRCDQAFATALEEVERCSYYQQNCNLPANGTAVIVRMQGRIGIETTNSELIGYLPTQYNYLASCIESGRSYAGIITSTSSTPIVVVRVDIAPVSS